MSAIVSRLLAVHARRLGEGAANQQLWSKVRTLSTASTPRKTPFPDVPDGLFIVPFPKLSHTMTKGKLVKWHKMPGDHIKMYDILFEVATEELTEEEFKEGDFAGSVNLVVEAHEEGYLAAVWQQEDPQKDVQIGTPLGVICDMESLLESARDYKCPTTNVYDMQQTKVPILTWQSFLSNGKREVKCMG